METVKKLLFVYNPVAGRGRIQKNLFEVVSFYASHDYVVTLCPVLDLDKYKELLFEGIPFDRVVCSGGDGTLHGLMNYLINNDIHMDVGYLPSGSTNDYANSLGISSDIKKALETSISGKAQLLDIGKFNDTYFLYVAAFGIFAKVSYSTPQINKNMLGHAAYILEGISKLSELKSYSIKIETENEKISGSFILGIVTNSLSVGGFTNILPDNTSLDDGEFEVMLFKKPKKLAELNELIISLTQNTLGDNPNVVTKRCSRLKITSKETLDWTLDGEFGGSCEECEITNLNRRLSVIHD